MPTTTGRATDYITFTRTSNATVTDSNGFIEWAGHNLLTNSESFDASAWTKSGYAVTANDVAAPGGTTTADKIAVSVGSAVEVYLRAATSQIASARTTLAVFAKAGNVNFLRLRNLAVSGGPSAWFNLSTGAVATVGSGLTASITSVGSGWYLCAVTGTTDTTVSFNFVDIASSATDNSIAGVLNEFIHIWGAHLYRSDLGGMVLNPARGDAYYPTTPRNLLGFTESLTTGWTNSNTTDSIVTETNPNGLASSVEVTATAGNGTLLGSLSLLASPYTFSIWLKRKTGTGTVEITVDGTTYVAAAVTGTWTRFSTTLTPTAGTKTPGIRLVTSGDAVFAWGAQLSDSASLDAYSPVYDAAVTSAAYYAPRLDYDPVTLGAKGLLVEEQRTNLLLHTADFTNAVWDANGGAVTVTANQATAPDGTLTADLLEDNTGNANQPWILQTFSGSAGTTYTFSIWAKAAGGSSATLWLYDNAGSTGATSAITLTSSWQRFTITRAITAGATLMRAGFNSVPIGGIHVWGAQLEAGSFATSYIPTGASTATRTADVASVSTQAFPYSATEGTLVGEVRGLLSSTITQVPLVNFGDANNRIELRAVGDPFTYNRAVVVNSGSTVVDINATGLPASASATRKVGLAFKLNDFATTGTGGTVGTTSSGTIPSVSVMNIGTAPYSASLKTNGWIARITYIPRRLSNSELQARTV